MEKDITEKTVNPFAGISEGMIDKNNKMISGVCLFGRRESDNDRVYSDKSVDTLTRLAEGAKCFVNHIGKSDTIRRVQDWLGVFRHTRREGDAVKGVLEVRGTYFDLMKDVVRMDSGIGMSLDGRVYVEKLGNGKESIVDFKRLNSVDLVSAPATVNGIFESLVDRIEISNNQDVEEFLKDMFGDKIKEIIDVTGLDAFLRDVKSSTLRQKDIIHQEVEQGSGAQGARLSRKEVQAAVKEYFGHFHGRELTKDETDLISDVFGI